MTKRIFPTLTLMFHSGSTQSYTLDPATDLKQVAIYIGENADHGLIIDDKDEDIVIIPKGTVRHALIERVR